MNISYPTLQSKLPDAQISIFAVMSRYAAEYNALNLSQGFPDFNPPAQLTALVKHYLDSGYNQYAPLGGVPLLRQKVSEKIERLYNRRYDPDEEITITSGATQAIYTAVSAVINSGDEVILLEPAYDSYAPVVKINGGIPVFVPLSGTGFSIDWDRVKDAFTPRTKLIILNSPHNPTGSVINETDIQILEELTVKYGIFVISDEVYEHILFDNNRHISLSSSEVLSASAFVISSFGKTYHATGWKAGSCAAPARLMREFRKIHQYNVFSIITPVQHAYADYMDNTQHYHNLGSFYQQKRDLFLNGIKDSRFKFKPAAGTYFQLLDYSEISDKNDMEFTLELVKDAGIAVIPLSPFYSPGYNGRVIRICFAKNDDVINKGAAILSGL